MKTNLLLTIALAFLGLSADSQNSWTPKANFGGTGRQGAVGFSIGNKGFIGTGDVGTASNDFWEWDVSTNVWTQKAIFGGVARWGAVGFSIGNKGYIGTGTNGSYYYQDFWEYDPSANSWTSKANFAGGARREAVGFSIGNKGYIGTGKTGSMSSGNDFYEFDPTLNSWTQKTNFGGATRYGAVGFSIGNKGYIGTGYVSGYGTNDFWEYNPAADSWIQKADFGGSARYFAIGFSIGNKGYIGTGGSGYKNDFWEYNSSTDVWIQKTNYLNTVWLAVGFSTCTKGYIGTGGVANYTYIKDFAEYTPSITPAAGFTASQTNFCTGTCINFIDTSTNVPTNWVWDFPGGTPNSSTSQNPTNICFNTAGTYTVTLIATSGNCSFTATKSITVNPFPSTTVTGNNTTCDGCCDGTATANATGGTGAYSYFWSNSQTTQEATGLCAGDYFVTVTASGCSTTGTVTISQSPVSINESNISSQIFIFPNPTSNEFTIENNSGVKIEKIEIYNALGQKVKTMVAGNGNISNYKIDIHSFATGTYTLQFFTSKGVINKMITVMEMD